MGKGIKEITKRKRKKGKTDSPRLTEMKGLVKEGYSLKKAMELAGYAPSTIQKKASEYLKKLDLDELKKGLKIETALSSYKAFKTLNEKMTNAEKDGDQIRAADAVLKAGKVYLTKEPGDTTLVFQLQTIQGEQIILNAPGKPDETIDIEPEIEEGG